MFGKIKIITETIIEINIPSEEFPGCNSLNDAVTYQQDAFDNGNAYIDDYIDENTTVRVEKYEDKKTN